MAHYRFRRAFVAQGHQLSELKYHATMFPFGPIFAFVFCMIVIVGQNIPAFIHLDWDNILITYMAVPIFLILFCYYKFRYKTHLLSLQEADLSRSSRGEKYITADGKEIK
jgi:lysine-specific permease